MKLADAPRDLYGRLLVVKNDGSCTTEMMDVALHMMDLALTMIEFACEYRTTGRRRDACESVGRPPWIY